MFLLKDIQTTNNIIYLEVLQDIISIDNIIEYIAK